MRLLSVWLVLVVLAAAANGAVASDQGEQIAPLLDGLGDFEYSVGATADDPMVRRFFNQGMMLAFGFNHKEATRSFREAARRDPDCAMCWWGVALVNGPNINALMSDDQVPVAWDALQSAVKLSKGAEDKEQALIKALEKRYGPDPVEDRTFMDAAYAEAMKQVARDYPDDPTVLALYAEALMDLHPWDYWQRDGEPQPWTQEIVNTLEKARKLDPDHPLANHLYIHSVEASRTPERGLEAAARLGNVAPGAGHLVHMPAHIYIRVGEYHEGSLANERAIESDNQYVAQCHAQGIYPLAYIPHNKHFLWATATMEGRSKVAIDAAKATAQVDAEMMRAPGMGTLQHFYCIPLYAYVRFGKWDEILNHFEPARDLVYPRGVWRYARGMAFVRTGRLADAADELSKLKKLAADPSLEEVTIWDINTTASLLDIASFVLEGEIAAADRDYETAIHLLAKAVEIEDSLAYNEPPDWFFPTRQNLGAILIEAGRFAAAEDVYRKDLEVFPRNGWSLYGMALALRGQGRNDEARRVEKAFQTAWQWSDIALSSSRL